MYWNLSVQTQSGEFLKWKTCILTREHEQHDATISGDGDGPCCVDGVVPSEDQHLPSVAHFTFVPLQVL